MNELSTGQNRVFETLEEASEVLGVNASTLSRAMSDCREFHGMRMKYVDRVYAVMLTGGWEWTVVVEDSRKSGYLVMGNPMKRIKKRDVARVKELTASWYWHDTCKESRV